MEKLLKFTVNGKEVEVNVQPDELLVDTLRDKFGLTGTKIGCGDGDCGACTVLVDGKTVTSCITLSLAVEGKHVQTIEGAQDDEKLQVIQQEYLDAGAVQCGFCIPGMVLSTKALLEENEKPTEQEIRVGLSGNLCRCTGYSKIVNAVENSAEKLSKNR